MTRARAPPDRGLAPALAFLLLLGATQAWSTPGPSLELTLSLGQPTGQPSTGESSLDRPLIHLKLGASGAPTATPGPASSIPPYSAGPDGQPAATLAAAQPEEEGRRIQPSYALVGALGISAWSITIEAEVSAEPLLDSSKPVKIVGRADSLGWELLLSP